jgi:futalosine hydrolase
MIALISSMPEEGRLFIRQLKERSVAAGRPVYRGVLYGKEVIYIISGMGKVNAAHTATVLLEKFSPDVVVLFGVGGAYPSTGLNVGDIAIAEKEVYGDEGVHTGRGFKGIEFIGIPLLRKGRKKYFNEFWLDKRLAKAAVETLKRFAPHCTHSCGFKAGTFVTVSAVTATEKRAGELRRRFGAICENMEGASVAHVCTIYGTPMIELRGISNIVEGRDKARWDLRLASDNCQRVVMEVIKSLLGCSNLCMI